MARTVTPSLVDINIDSLSEKLSNTEISYNSLNEISDTIMKSYCSALDESMQDIYNEIISTNGNYDPRLLDIHCLKLTNILFFMQDKLESVGLKEDISRSLAKESYNRAYLDNQAKDAAGKNKTTVAESTAVAEEKSKEEQVVTFLYNRCYKLLKQKIDSGYEMVNTLRKIITKNIQEMSLSRFDNKVILGKDE